MRSVHAGDGAPKHRTSRTNASVKQEPVLEDDDDDDVVLMEATDEVVWKATEQEPVREGKFNRLNVDEVRGVLYQEDETFRSRKMKEACHNDSKRRKRHLKNPLDLRNRNCMEGFPPNELGTWKPS